MRYNDHCYATSTKLIDLLVTFLLKAQIADRQNFVDQKNFGIKADGDRKPQPGNHSRRISAQRLIQEPPQFAERNDFIHLPQDLITRESEQDSVQNDIFSSGQIDMETRSHF